jgi:hypothetical protein
MVDKVAEGYVATLLLIASLEEDSKQKQGEYGLKNARRFPHNICSPLPANSIR